MDCYHYAGGYPDFAQLRERAASPDKYHWVLADEASVSEARMVNTVLCVCAAAVDTECAFAKEPRLLVTSVNFDVQPAKAKIVIKTHEKGIVTIGRGGRRVDLARGYEFELLVPPKPHPADPESWGVSFVLLEFVRTGQNLEGAIMLEIEYEELVEDTPGEYVTCGHIGRVMRQVVL